MDQAYRSAGSAFPHGDGNRQNREVSSRLDPAQWPSRFPWLRVIAGSIAALVVMAVVGLLLFPFDEWDGTASDGASREHAAAQERHELGDRDPAVSLPPVKPSRPSSITDQPRTLAGGIPGVPAQAKQDGKEPPVPSATAARPSDIPLPRPLSRTDATAIPAGMEPPVAVTKVPDVAVAVPETTEVAVVPPPRTAAGATAGKAPEPAAADPAPMPQPVPKPLTEAAAKPVVSTVEPPARPASKTPVTSKQEAQAAAAREAAVARQREVDELIAQAEALYQAGDVASARSSYEMAFAKGSSEAALRLGRTFDPVYVRRRGQASPAEAILWYQDAKRKGNRQAARELDELAGWLEQAAAGGNKEAQRILDAWSR